MHTFKKQLKDPVNASLFARLFTFPSLCTCLLVLMAPALWNGYALVFYDTGGYVEAAMGRYLVPGRSYFYGLFLQIFSLNWWSFWGVIAVQAGCTLWILQLLWRCHHLPGGGAPLLAVTTLLSLLTSLPWYAAQLMPDIFVPLMVLAVWLLVAHGHALRTWESIGLGGVALLAMLFHMSCLALALGLVGVLLIKGVLASTWPLRVQAIFPTLLVAAAFVLMPSLHYLLVGTAQFTPGGPAFLFGSLVQDGLAKRWLREHCPAPGVQLCAWKETLPETADAFLWSKDSPYKKIGDWKASSSQRELGQLVKGIVLAYPGMIVAKAVHATAEQVVRVATGEGLDGQHWDTRGILTTFLPRIAGPLNRARQQQEDLTPELLSGWNRLHVPIALASMTLLLPVLWWGLRTGRRPIAGLALFVLVALLGNAFICGALSNPHDRYQSRLVWLAPLVMVLALAEKLKSRTATPSHGRPLS
nr:hypothetical protein [uncultured Desulfobulbus sp.]